MALRHTLIKTQVIQLIDLPDSDHPMRGLAETLTHTVDTTTRLLPLYRGFFEMLCEERDHVNQLFRVFVDSYVVAISRVPYYEISPRSLIVSPLVFHSFRFLNAWAMIPYFPKPVYFGTQIRAELRYQARVFVKQAQAALERIQYSAEALEQFNDIFNVIAVGSTAVDNARARLQAKQINWWTRLREWLGHIIHILGHVDDQTKLTERMATQIRTMNQSLPRTSFIGVANLLGHLDLLRRNFQREHTFEFSLSGTIAVPQSLQDTIRLSNSSWLRPAWRGVHAEAVNVDVYDYDLGRIHDSELPRVRKQVLDLCRARTNQDILSGTLYTICTFWQWSESFTGLERGVVSEAQINWKQARREATLRWQESVVKGEHPALKERYKSDGGFPEFDVRFLDS
ncbi:MAG: hypothetical protein Q9174_005125 [Haloplaca sp. 1 TL-2023]